MSKLFFDSLVDLSEVEKEIKKAVKDKDSQEELIHLVDEMVHHRVLGCILDHLPEHHHEEFATHVTDRPYDGSIMHYLTEKIGQDITGFIREEVHALGHEVLDIIYSETSSEKKKD